MSTLAALVVAALVAALIAYLGTRPSRDERDTLARIRRAGF